MERPFTIYITAGTLLSELSTPAGREAAAARLRDSRFRRVILEAYRGGDIVGEDALREARDYFSGQGFAAMGGLMPVWGKDFGKCGEGVELRNPFFCYSHEETPAAIEGEIRKLARVFDQVVIDDAFLTGCRCPMCREKRGERDWGVFRRELLCGVARRWMAAAHQENPRVRLTVKFPQYYDRCQRFGYDQQRFPEIFDAVWVGTETRDPATADYGYVEPYQGYFNTRWMQACAREKFECAWFDYLDCDEQLFYDQAVTTFLAAPPDVTVFCYSHELFGGGKMARLTQAVPLLGRFRQMAIEPRGVHVLKPPNSDGEKDLFVFDNLGMIGIPCVPVTQLETSMHSVIVPAHGADDPSMPSAAAAIVEAGGTVIATFNALHRMSGDAAFLELFGYDASGVATAAVEADRLICDGNRITCETPVRLAGDLAPCSATVTIWAELEGCERGTISVPLESVKTHPSGGKAIVWNLHTFGHDAFLISEHFNVPVPAHWFSFPKPVLDLLRHSATEPLGFRLTVPPRVACYLFAEHLVAANYASRNSELQAEGLAFDAPTLLTDSANTKCAGNSLLLSPNSCAAIAYRPQS